ncbi:polysaccharide biosynthesis protein [Macrococcus brunensis]|uniref:Polysaccharide biosynthesis protein n=1 Tax=Macrococcus brunensis TaxID=198483 RepID=A0A4R6BB97_9STAP|nr:polysaccharide biosynthesis protein [Macrococcus brunensis]TDL94242.1 polysaccharide biosynthesis protein [Macrococcus brunensis]
MAKNNVFNSVIILTVSMLLVKILSALYRVPYQNVLGDTGLYAYQQVYPVAAIVAVLSLNAVPSVISQFDHEYAEKVYRLLRISSFILLILFMIFSGLIARLMGDPNLTSMLRISLLVLLPFSFVAVARGELQQRDAMRTIAVSQLIDQVIRVSVILLGIYLYTTGFSIYESGAVSILGSFLGISGAWLYLRRKGRIKPADSLSKTQLKQFLLLTLFYALSYLIMILWQLVDSFTVLNMLKHIGYSLQDSRELKGIYDRGASLIQMGLIVTTSFALVLIPLLAQAKRQGHHQEMNDYASSALKITIVFSSAASIGLLNLIKPFNLFLFKSDTEAVTLAVYMLAVIFVSLIIMFTAMLQITEDYQIQAIGVVSGLLTKIVLNIVLIANFGILGAAIATVSGLVVYTIVLFRRIIQRYTLQLKSFTVRWAMTLVVMSIVLQFTLQLPFTDRLSALIVSLVGVAAGVLIVGSAMIKFKIISADEWIHLPFGEHVIRWMK